MRNLISVGLFRTVRSKLFYILLALTALAMAYLYYNTYRLQLGPDFAQLDLYFFQFINANIVSVAVFCPLFLSSEYGAGDRLRVALGEAASLGLGHQWAPIVRLSR